MGAFIGQSDEMVGQQIGRWERQSLQPGAEWEWRVSRAIYKDGAVTFNQVDRYLAVRDTTACARFLSSGNELEWNQQATQLPDLPCP